MKNTINVEDDKLIISTTIFGETIKTQVSITKDMIKQKSDLSKYDSALPADEFNFIVDNFLNIIKANPKGYFSNSNDAGKYNYYAFDKASPMRLHYIHNGESKAFEMQINDLEKQTIEIKKTSRDERFSLSDILDFIYIARKYKDVSDRDYIQILIDELKVIKNAE